MNEIFQNFDSYTRWSWENADKAYEGWNSTSSGPTSNGAYRVLIQACDIPFETFEGIDEFRFPYWIGYQQFVIGWKPLNEKI